MDPEESKARDSTDASETVSTDDTSTPAIPGQSSSSSSYTAKTEAVTPGSPAALKIKWQKSAGLASHYNSPSDAKDLPPVKNENVAAVGAESSHKATAAAKGTSRCDSWLTSQL